MAQYFKNVTHENWYYIKYLLQDNNFSVHHKSTQTLLP